MAFVFCINWLFCILSLLIIENQYQGAFIDQDWYVGLDKWFDKWHMKFDLIFDKVTNMNQNNVS